MTRRGGLIVRRDQLSQEERCRVAGLPVTSGLRTSYDLARTSGLEAAVAAVDALLRARIVASVDLLAYVSQQSRARGLVQARRVTELMDADTRSPQESRLRLVWMLDAGLPRPRVNRPVYAVDGWFLGIPDLLDEESGLVAEYDGAGHREAKQHAHDNAREELMEHHGLVVVRACASDLGAHRTAFVHRLRAAYAHAERQSASHRRWTLHPANPWGFRQNEMASG